MFYGVSSGFRRRVYTHLCFVALLALTTTGRIHALERATPLSRLGRQSWTMENGLPQNTISVLLQSRSGFLFAGTELGLARFDGSGFRILDHGNTPSFPDAEIRCLLDAPQDGSLWVGTGDGLVRWLNGRATRFTTANGLPANSIQALTQTTDGVLWVWTDAGLAHLSGDRFEPAVDPTLQPQSITSIAAGADSALWVASSAGIAVERDGVWKTAGFSAKSSETGQPLNEHPSLVRAGMGGNVLLADENGTRLVSSGSQTLVLSRPAMPSDGVSFLAQLPDGTVVVASKSQVMLAQQAGNRWRTTARFAVGKDLPGSRIESLYADREGSLWIGTNHGLARILIAADQVKVERMPGSDPLATDSVLSILEDREGDIWAGTEAAGLHILRDSRFRILSASDGLSSDATTAIVEDAHHGTWIGTRDSGLNHVTLLQDGTVANTILTTKEGLLSNVILSLASAPNGDLWVGTPDGLNRIAGKTTFSFTSADGLPDDFIRSVLVAPDTSLWIGTRRGLTHFRPSATKAQFETFTHKDGLGSDLVGALAVGRDGDLWIATLNGLTHFQNGKFRNFTTADGLSSDVITALEPTLDGMLWIGTQGDGLNLWNGAKFLPVRDAHVKTSELPSAIHAILDDQTHIWIASGSGLTRIERPYAVTCARTSNCGPNPAAVLNFNTADGLRSRETSSNSHPTASRAADGTLRFTTPRGVILVDPLHFPAAPPPPPVVIERFAVDDRDMPVGAASQRITAGAMRLQFDYAGLSFASPQKLRYQYKLDGFDRDWIDASTRRTAYYTNIPPAKYTFRVRAALSDTAFESSPQGPAQTASYSLSYAPQQAVLNFELEPHYYQTIWFRALLAILIVALVVVIFRRRVLRVEREFRAVMAERNRIAREIHDTLAQGYVGISLQLEILGQLLHLNRADAAQKHLTLTQDMVREGLDDARQSIWALRSQDSAEQTLPIRLRRLVEQAADHQLTSDFKVHGAVRPLAPEAEQEILRIAQESIHNVKKHAGASRLDVHLEYEHRLLALTIADNGKGFQQVPRKPAPEGHYGLTGMQERAALIHAEILIESQPALGTTVKLKVPAPGAQ
jgi:signal transduction histidine kinase/ligand-binding sensor domain-containing protein